MRTWRIAASISHSAFLVDVIRRFTARDINQPILLMNDDLLITHVCWPNRILIERRHDFCIIDTTEGLHHGMLIS
jgi:hypothetical protein